MAGEKETDAKIPDLFQSVWDLYSHLEKCDESTASESIQTRLKDVIEKGEMAVHMLNIIGLFSRNEDLEEVATNEIKFMLFPALLGTLILRRSCSSRLAVIEQAQGHFVDFLNLMKDYGVTNVNVPNIMHAEEESGEKPRLTSGNNDEQFRQEQMVNMARDRAAKIERFKRRKAANERLVELETRLTESDDDTHREYYTALISKWVDISIDELESMKMELPFAKRAACGDALTLDSCSNEKPPSRSRVKPFILTRDAVQAKVFGLGYTSLPTYTLEEFGERQYQLLCEQNGGVPPTPQVVDDPDIERIRIETEEARKELEVDDDESLAKARAMDDWKDDHRRGWGNRMNRS